MAVTGETLPGAPEPLTEREQRFKALHETLMVTADVALEAGEDRIAELLQSMAGQGGTVERLADFQMAARQAAWSNERLDVDRPGAHYVQLEKVWELLKNFALGVPPGGLKADEKVPRPAWYGKDVTGYLLQRGWKPMKGYAGMHRNGQYIHARDIQAINGVPNEDVLLLERMARPMQVR